MRLLAIDPGPTESALLIYDTDTGLPVEWAKEPNSEAWFDDSPWWAADRLAIEMVASYGMAVGREVFETCAWAGRYIERFCGGAPERRYPVARGVYRREVKMHLCGSTKAKDANVRQALIDRYGGKEKAIGRKAAPGPLYGLSGDCWSALAVAITVADARP